MKSDMIKIDSNGTGYDLSALQAKKVAAYIELNKRDAMSLQLLTEEILSMANSITGEMNACFWIETNGHHVDIHLTTETVMSKEKRALLISSSTNKKNSAANSFLSKLRDKFEEAMASDVDVDYNDLPSEILSDLPSDYTFDPVWDGYERSILKLVADNISISIRGKQVEMIVSKSFSE